MLKAALVQTQEVEDDFKQIDHKMGTMSSSSLFAEQDGNSGPSSLFAERDGNCGNPSPYLQRMIQYLEDPSCCMKQPHRVGLRRCDTQLTSRFLNLDLLDRVLIREIENWKKEAHVISEEEEFDDNDQWIDFRNSVLHLRAFFQPFDDYRVWSVGQGNIRHFYNKMVHMIINDDFCFLYSFICSFVHSCWT